MKINLLSVGSAISVLASPLVMPHLAYAQDDRAQPINLIEGERAQDDEIVVSASRIAQPRDETGQTISVITKDDLERSQSVVLSDILQSVPGVTLARNGGVGSLSSLFIRGADSAHTLVLIDGVRLNDPSSPSGAYDFGNLLTGNIGRVEVMRGPNAVIWGSQAIGGVVNIQTIEPDAPFSFDGRGEYGWRDTGELRGNVSAKGELGELSISGSFGGGWYRTEGISAYNEARGGLERDGYRQYGANGKLRIGVGAHVSLDLRGFYSDSRVEFDNPPSDSLPETDSEQYTGYAGLNIALFDGALKNRFAYSRSEITRNTRDPAPGSFNPFDAKGTLNRYEYQGAAEFTGWLGAVFGVEHEDSFSSTFFHAFDVAPDRTETGMTSYYGQLQLKPVTGLSIAGGIRIDDHRVYSSKTSFGGNFAYSPNQGQTVLRGTYAEGFRAPALPELLANFGNADLQPETAKAFDIGLEQHFLDQHLGLSATYFYRDTDNLIVFSSASSQLENIASARVQGLEFSLYMKPTERLEFKAAYSHIDSQNRSRALDFFGNSNFDNRLARRPVDTLSFQADWRSQWGLDLGAFLLMVGESYDDLANANRLEGYVLANIRASFAISERFSLYGRIENLFDENYETVLNFGTLGRAGYIGVRANF